jgi:hypothetical protein
LRRGGGGHKLVGARAGFPARLSIRGPPQGPRVKPAGCRLQTWAKLAHVFLMWSTEWHPGWSHDGGRRQPSNLPDRASILTAVRGPMSVPHRGVCCRFCGPHLGHESLNSQSCGVAALSRATRSCASACSRRVTHPSFEKRSPSRPCRQPF